MHGASENRLSDENASVIPSQDEELSQFLTALHMRYGYDFRAYARASLRRRIATAMRKEGHDSFAKYLAQLLADSEAMERLLLSISVNVTTMFRDPGLYRAIRKNLIPYLRTYPFIRIWHAGCSTGEEVYSLAVLLEEEGVYGKCKIYATDMNEAVLRRAREGIFPLASMRRYTANYLAAGGKSEFSEYYSARYGKAMLRASLRRNMVFAQHNLVSDGSFNEFNLIFCRNVMIYFNNDLQRHVHELLYTSLAPFGFLVLGPKEPLRFSARESYYHEVDAENKIFRKVR